MSFLFMFFWLEGSLGLYLIIRGFWKWSLVRCLERRGISFFERFVVFVVRVKLLDFDN